VSRYQSLFDGVELTVVVKEVLEGEGLYTGEICVFLGIGGVMCCDWVTANKHCPVSKNWIPCLKTIGALLLSFPAKQRLIYALPPDDSKNCRVPSPAARILI
jgi:hypothetical protein